MRFISPFASSSASDNIPKADEIRTLVKDVWDTRIAKLRVSADSFVRQQEAHAKVGVLLAWTAGCIPRPIGEGSVLPTDFLCGTLLV